MAGILGLEGRLPRIILQQGSENVLQLARYLGPTH